METFSLSVNDVDLSGITILDITLSIGRKEVWSHTEAGALTVRILSGNVGLNNLLTLESKGQLSVNINGISYILFTGWLTDIKANTSGWGLWEHEISFVGPLAELTQIEVTNINWPLETDSQRIARIITLANRSTESIPVGILGPSIIASEPEEESKQTAEEEMAITAESAGGLIYEDHAKGIVGYQPSNMRYEGEPIWDLASLSWDITTGNWDNAGIPVARFSNWIIPASRVLFDPFSWEQHSGDLIKYYEVTYGPYSEEDRPVIFSGIPNTRQENFDSLLQNQADAQSLADRIIATRSIPKWNAPLVVLRVDLMSLEEMQDLFENRLFPGMPVEIQQLPPGSPFANFEGFIEGWEHRITYDENATTLVWELELWLSDKTLTMPMTTWDQISSSWDSISDPWNTVTVNG